MGAIIQQLAQQPVGVCKGHKTLVLVSELANKLREIIIWLWANLLDISWMVLAMPQSDHILVLV